MSEGSEHVATLATASPARRLEVHLTSSRSHAWLGFYERAGRSGEFYPTRDAIVVPLAVLAPLRVALEHAERTAAGLPAIAYNNPSFRGGGAG